jgi:hypothetical protein
MTRIVWDNVDERPYEWGVDRGVLYVHGEDVVPWNGLISVDEDEVSGSELRSFFEGFVYANFYFGGFFQGSVEAFGYPKEFLSALGINEVLPGLNVTAQTRASFDFAYRTRVGEEDYKLHLVYNALALQTKFSAKTMDDNISPETYTWDISTIPPAADTYRPTAHLVIDTTRADAAVVEALEDLLYGTDILAPSFPTQVEVVALFTP